MPDWLPSQQVKCAHQLMNGILQQPHLIQADGAMTEALRQASSATISAATLHKPKVGFYPSIFGSTHELQTRPRV
eukprot:1158377-Pelagomonas_calceolata.AAC.4